MLSVANRAAGTPPIEDTQRTRAATLMLAEPQRSDGIDVLRGVCVLLVTLHHIHLRFKLLEFDVNALLTAPIARVLFWSGYFAVITFFVISGFLITSMSLRRWGGLDRIGMRQFYWLRFSRIAPCLLLVVLLLAALHLAHVDGFVIVPERSSLGRAVLAALTFHVNWLEGHHGYLPGGWDVLWSLSVEEVFYLSFPAVCLLARRRWLLAPLLALVVVGPFNRVSLAGLDPWEDYAYLSCMDGIAWGCLAALVAARLQPGVGALRGLTALGIAAVSSVIVFRGFAGTVWLRGLGLDISILEVGVALILIALAGGLGRQVLARGTGALRMVGRCSYEIYLTHMLVILGVMPAFLALKLEPSLACHGVLLAASVALGWVVNKVYSEPLNRALRSRYPRPVEERAAPTP